MYNVYYTVTFTYDRLDGDQERIPEQDVARGVGALVNI